MHKYAIQATMRGGGVGLAAVSTARRTPAAGAVSSTARPSPLAPRPRRRWAARRRWELRLASAPGRRWLEQHMHACRAQRVELRRAAVAVPAYVCVTSCLRLRPKQPPPEASPQCQMRLRAASGFGRLRGQSAHQPLHGRPSGLNIVPSPRRTRSCRRSECRWRRPCCCSPWSSCMDSRRRPASRCDSHSRQFCSCSHDHLQVAARARERADRIMRGCQWATAAATGANRGGARARAGLAVDAARG